MAHGYFRDYDEDREQSEDRESDRDRGFMFEGRAGRRSFSSNPDDHYLSWRDKQIQALDREYEDYCREREQRFHREFDQWRAQRRGNTPPLQAGMTQSGPSHDTDGIMELTDTARPIDAAPDPMAEATLGAESSGRGRR